VITLSDAALTTLIPKSSHHKTGKGEVRSVR